MTPRKILAQLQRESKPSKFRNKPVYACRLCWHEMILLDKKPERKNDILLCTNCNLDGYRYDCTIFDSLAEHTRGLLDLKPLKTAGVITDLRHHKVFKLWPRLWGSTWLDAETGERIFLTTHDEDIVFDDNVEIPHKYGQYKSDFTYKQKGEVIVEEAKELTRIDKTTSKTTAAGQKITQTVKVDFPYFTSDEDFRHFRKICQLMFAIHGHRVQVRAGGFLWMFTDEGELEIVHGRIK